MKIHFENLEEFITIEKEIVKGFKVRLMYVDIAGDLMAGILLSQIIYWYSPTKSKNNKHANKLRVKKDGFKWIAKQRDEWWDEIRITPRQYDRAKKKLIDKDLIEVKNYKFNGLKTHHIRLKEDNFMKLINNYLKIKKEETLEKEVKSVDTTRSNETVRPVSLNSKTGLTNTENRSLQNRKTGLNKSVKPLTKNTTYFNNKNNKTPSHKNNKNTLNYTPEQLKNAVVNLNNDVKEYYKLYYNESPNPTEALLLNQLSKKTACYFIQWAGGKRYNQKLFITILKDIVESKVKTIEDFEEHINKKKKQNNKVKSSNKSVTNKEEVVDPDKELQKLYESGYR